MIKHDIDEIPELYNPLERSQILVFLSNANTPCHIQSIAQELGQSREFTEKHLRFLVDHKILSEDPPEYYRYWETLHGQLTRALVKGFLQQPGVTAQTLAHFFTQEGVQILQLLLSGGQVALNADDETVHFFPPDRSKDS